jgi:hypothetical protein
LKDKGHSILWTPPYSPDLQPIELFWAAGKNHARMFARNGITMRETVKYVREGWYGNEESWDKNNDEIRSDYCNVRKQATDCNALFQHTINQANTTFIPICSGISGVMGELIINETHKANKEGLPVDMLILSATNVPDQDDDVVIINEMEDDETNDEQDGAYALCALATSVL